MASSARFIAASRRARATRRAPAETPEVLDLALYHVALAAERVQHREHVALSGAVGRQGPIAQPARGRHEGVPREPGSQHRLLQSRPRLDQGPRPFEPRFPRLRGAALGARFGEGRLGASGIPQGKRQHESDHAELPIRFAGVAPLRAPLNRGDRPARPPDAGVLQRQRRGVGDRARHRRDTVDRQVRAGGDIEILIQSPGCARGRGLGPADRARERGVGCASLFPRRGELLLSPARLLGRLLPFEAGDVPRLEAALGQPRERVGGRDLLSHQPQGFLRGQRPEERRADLLRHTGNQQGGVGPGTPDGRVRRAPLTAPNDQPGERLVEQHVLVREVLGVLVGKDGVGRLTREPAARPRLGDARSRLGAAAARGDATADRVVQGEGDRGRSLLQGGEQEDDHGMVPECKSRRGD